MGYRALTINNLVIILIIRFVITLEGLVGMLSVMTHEMYLPSDAYKLDVDEILICFHHVKYRRMFPQVQFLILEIQILIHVEVDA